MKRVLSGIQPTGKLHLGNYLGAVKNWAKMQREHDCYFTIVDMHAITSTYFQTSSGLTLAEQLVRSTKETAATLIAAGIDPKFLFVQSQVPEHAELMWVFSCISPMHWYNRMTQYKDKKEALSGASLGLLAYPALMTADILLYKAELVPVGDDQTQHLELARDVAERFNSLFRGHFPVPKAVFSQIHCSNGHTSDESAGCEGEDEQVSEVGVFPD